MSSTRYSCWSSIKFEVSRQVFGKSPNITFHQNPSSGSPVVPYGRTGGKLQFVLCQKDSFRLYGCETRSLNKGQGQETGCARLVVPQPVVRGPLSSIE